MTIYIFLFVLITIPMLFLVCVVGGGMLGSYLGQRIGNMRLRIQLSHRGDAATSYRMGKSARIALWLFHRNTSGSRI